jgi:hypothetical protein
MSRRLSLVLCSFHLLVGLGATGCRSAGWGTPILQIQNSAELSDTASPASTPDEPVQQTGSHRQCAKSETLTLCSGEATAPTPDDGPLLSESDFADNGKSSVEDHVPYDVAAVESFSFRADLSQSGSMLWDDTKALFNWQNAAILSAGIGGTLAIRSTLDDDVRSATYQHGDRWGGGSELLSNLGEAYVQWPAWIGLYAYSLHAGDEELHEMSGALFSSLALTGISTTIIKFSANTDRPSTDFENGHYGFPSYHAASSFAIAGVIDEYYGLRAGLPAYALAGLIGWSRIDLRAHDLSDVVFGAVLGTVIGKSVAHYHRTGDGRFQLSPWYEPNTRSTGVMWEMTFD